MATDYLAIDGVHQVKGAQAQLRTKYNMKECCCC